MKRMAVALLLLAALPAAAADKTAAELLAEARTHLAAGEFALAAERAKAATELEPENLEAFTVLGDAAVQGQLWAEAEAAYRAAMALDAADANLPLRAGDAAWRQEQTDEAETLFLLAIARLGNNAELLRQVGEQAVQRRLPIAAKLAAQLMLDQDAGLAVAHNLLAYAYELSDRLTLAELAFRRTLEIAPGEPVVTTSIGRVLRKQKRHALAEDVLRAVIASSPNHADAHNELGVLLSEQDRRSEAVEAFAQAALLEPQNTTMLANHGDTLLKLERWQEAETVLRKLLDLTGPNESVQKLLDQALAGQAQP